jgi:hypothetical protein
MRKVRYVVGKVDGPLNLADDERVIFAGSCTSWEGKIDGQYVNIKSSYKTSSQIDESKTKSNDMLLKITGALIHAFLNRNRRYIHVKGCPLSVGQHVNYLSSLGKIGNPNFDPKLFIQANINYYQMRFHRFMARFAG